jgi:hypothetical protein
MSLRSSYVPTVFIYSLHPSYYLMFFIWQIYLVLLYAALVVRPPPEYFLRFRHVQISAHVGVFYIYLFCWLYLICLTFLFGLFFLFSWTHQGAT